MHRSSRRASADLVDRLLEAAAGTRVLVVGDAMVDHYVTGSVDRISPEAPVPVVRVEEEHRAPGGAANVAAGVTALGAACRLVCVRGEDREGGELERLLRDRDVATGGMLRVASRPTTVKTRVVARHQQMVRIDRESTASVSEPVRRRLLRHVREDLEWADVVALVDYDKGMLDQSLGSRVVGEAAERGIPSVVDPKLRSFFDYRGADVFKPNGEELAAAHGREAPPTDPDELREIRRRLGCRQLLVTLGGEGMMLVEEGSEPVRIPSEPREVYDVSGAGDTVTAMLAATAAGAPDGRDAAVVANFAAGLQVARLGAVPVSAPDLRAAARGERPHSRPRPGNDHARPIARPWPAAISPDDGGAAGDGERRNQARGGQL